MKKMISALLALTLAGTIASAGGRGGGQEGNGGDAEEMTFKNIVSDIFKWVHGSQIGSLELPPGISPGIYRERMLTAVAIFHIAFTDDEVDVDHVMKTCRNYVGYQNNGFIICNRDLFRQTSVEEQYRLVHHELAGLAGLEVGENGDSDYRISNQISGYLRVETVKRLPVGQEHDENICRIHNADEFSLAVFSMDGQRLSDAIPDSETANHALRVIYGRMLKLEHDHICERPAAVPCEIQPVAEGRGPTPRLAIYSVDEKERISAPASRSELTKLLEYLQDIGYCEEK